MNGFGSGVVGSGSDSTYPVLVLATSGARVPDHSDLGAYFTIHLAKLLRMDSLLALIVDNCSCQETWGTLERCFTGLVTGDGFAAPPS